MSKLLANHALIICTKNRESVLNQQKIALEKCVSLPQQIIIVDASNTKNQESHKNRYVSLGVELSILSTKEGLPKQRNAGILALNSNIEIVHFLDDDFSQKLIISKKWLAVLVIILK